VDSSRAKLRAVFFRPYEGGEPCLVGSVSPAISAYRKTRRENGGLRASRCTTPAIRPHHRAASPHHPGEYTVPAVNLLRCNIESHRVAETSISAARCVLYSL